MSDDPLNDNPLTDREAEALAAELGIEFSKTPLCLHFGQKASEPCWGEVEGRICRGHAWIGHNGRYYSEEDTLKARKTGGRLYPTFTPRTESPLPDVSPELVELWDLLEDGDWEKAWDRAQGRRAALNTVNEALARTKLPRDPKDNPPPPRVPTKTFQGSPVGVALGTDGRTMVLLQEQDK